MTKGAGMTAGMEMTGLFFAEMTGGAVKLCAVIRASEMQHAHRLQLIVVGEAAEKVKQLLVGALQAAVYPYRFVAFVVNQTDHIGKLRRIFLVQSPQYAVQTLAPVAGAKTPARPRLAEYDKTLPIISFGFGFCHLC